MSHPQQFRLSSRGMLFAAVSVAFAQSSFANSGRVDFAAGNITATGADGASRRLVKGNEVKTGDRIVSDGSGRAQIRFTDGSFVSLQPNTDFDIKNYAFNGRTDGTEKALFGLLKGAMRTVTGLVGRVNRDAYQITTPTATVGIRGTGGLIYIAPDGSTWILGSSGVWTMTNPAGSVEVPAGTSATSAADGKRPPERTEKLPVYTAPKVEETKKEYAQGETRSSSGAQADIPTFKPLVTGSGYSLAYHGGGSSAGGEGGTINNNSSGTYGTKVNATFTSLGLMTAFSQDSIPGGFGIGYSGQLGPEGKSGSHAEFSTTSGVLAWGRWIGTMNVGGTTQTASSNQGLHYVVGTPPTSMPTGQKFTYDMIGSTKPTAIDGSVAPGTLTSATLSGTFGVTGLTGVSNLSLAGTIGGKTFNAPNVSGYINNAASATFCGSGSYTGTLNPSCSSVSVIGFFAGSGASNAGFTYQLNNTSLVGSPAVVGAAAFSKGAAVALPPP